ncbi:MAG TPA: 3-dehydroquinate synthase [Bacillota bacterium]|nr:3-dehydroquinate synthase [Bacillota bacterium]
MKELIVELGERSYPIRIGRHLLQGLPQELVGRGVDVNTKLFIVTDNQVAPLYLDNVLALLTNAGYVCSTHIVPSGEKAKTLAQLEEVTASALTAGIDRKSVVLALGGGVVGDLAGFCAASYMRGIPFIQLPTTLLAHDSSVGGKVAVNHPLAKNIIGAFHQPLMVLYDTSTLTTLPAREIYAGFAELIKHGLIWSNSLVEWLGEHSRELLALESPYIDEAIQKGCSIKAQVVSEDETEQGIRAILNLGHTFGHALEALTSFGELIHGEAVAIGMVAAALLAERIGLCDPSLEVSKQTISLLKKFNLPVRMPHSFDPVEVLEAMRHDKKGSGGKLVFVLPTQIGKVEIIKDVQESAIIETLRMLKEVD